MSINDKNSSGKNIETNKIGYDRQPLKIKEFFRKYFFEKQNETDKKAGFDKSEKKTLNPMVIWLCVGAIIILFAVRIFSSGDNPTNTDKGAETTAQPAAVDSNVYASDMERDLKEILEKINGAGSVSVRIYIDSTSEKILAENSKSESNLSEREDERSESSASERNAVMSSGGSGLSSSGSPYVVREKLPYPIGVLVVAEGAKNERVRIEMYEAVKALYGLSANRIKITY